VTCHSCKIEAVKAGKDRNDVQRSKCQQCGKRFSEAQQKPFGVDVRLLERDSLPNPPLPCGRQQCARYSRLCGVEPRTVLNMLTLAGEVCERLFENHLRNVQVKDLELDEFWTFVGCKQRQLTPERFEKGMTSSAWSARPNWWWLGISVRGTSLRSSYPWLRT
jgi:hypothetical protein